MRFFDREARGWEVAAWISATLIITYAYAICLFQITQIFPSLRIPPTGFQITEIRLYWPLVVVLLAFLEEFCFRFLPLLIIREEGMHSPREIFIVICLSSFLFGIAHGSITHLFFQGLSGFLSSALFLKCGGYHGNYLKALAVVGAEHSLHNTVPLTIRVWLGTPVTYW